MIRASQRWKRVSDIGIFDITIKQIKYGVFSGGACNLLMKRGEDFLEVTMVKIASNNLKGLRSIIIKVMNV